MLENGMIVGANAYDPQEKENRIAQVFAQKKAEETQLEREQEEVEDALGSWRYMTFGLRDTIRRMYADRLANLRQEIRDLEEASERMGY